MNLNLKQLFCNHLRNSTPIILENGTNDRVCEVYHCLLCGKLLTRLKKGK